MIKDQSYGVIPLRYEGGVWQVLLICHTKGSFWCFPKGHPESDESPYQAAARELFEETGLSIKRLLSDKTFEEQYSFRSSNDYVHKTVTYFLGEVEGILFLQEEEVADSQWVDLEKAESKITFPEAQSLIRQVIDILSK